MRMIISKHSWTGNQVERHININFIGKLNCGWMDTFVKEHVKHKPNFMPEKGAMKRYDYTNIARPE